MSRRFLPSVLLVAMIAYGVRPGGALLSLGLLCLLQLAVLAAFARHRLLRRVLMSTTTFTVMLVAAELVAMRLWPIAPHRILAREDSPVASAYLEDPELGLVFSPNFRGRFVHPEYRGEAFETNADGFRGPDWPDPLPDEEPRVLVLGDSITLGYGVDASESIPGVLERLLRERWSAARVFNAGVAGYGPRHQRILLERLMGRIRPTHVVVVFYDGNDLKNCRAQLDLVRGGGQADTRAPVAARPPSLLSPVYWTQRSALGRRLATALVAWKVSRGALMKHHAFDGILSVTRLQPGEEVVEELELAVQAVAEMDARCAEVDARFLFVRMPMRIQAEVAAFENLVELYDQDMALHDRALPGRALLEACEERGIQALDLLPVIEIPGRGPNHFFFAEGHPNRLGNETIAGCIFDRMVGQGLLEPGAPR